MNIKVLHLEVFFQTFFFFSIQRRNEDDCGLNYCDTETEVNGRAAWAMDTFRRKGISDFFLRALE
jgi:hypothetical protein